MVNLSNEEFIRRSIDKHGIVYDYSKTKYISSNEKLIITCRKHGDFEQFPFAHLRGSICKKCSDEKSHSKRRITKEEFIKRSSETHCNKYDYSKVVYIDIRTRVVIVCPIHGDFKKLPTKHLRGSGCTLCETECTEHKLISKKDKFLNRANKVHKNKYEYKLDNYKIQKDIIEIICPVHGSFKQKALDHLNGSGCPICAKNKKSTTEEFIKKATEIHQGRYDYSKVVYTSS